MTEESYSAVSLQEGFILHDRYKIVSVLGRGGFSYTYKAQDTKLDRTVAVKEYFPASVAFRTGLTVMPVDTKSQDSYSAGLRSFIDEAKILARFRDENICSVWDYFEENGTAYLIMSYISGEPLDTVLQKCPNGVMNSGAVRLWLIPLLGALQKLHAASYIHRDIKPSNIFITYDGKPVLLDFGAARVSVGRTHGYTVILTPEYAPPEQSTTDIAAQGPWTDLYAIAAVAYKCLMGATPPDAQKRILAMANGKADPLDETMPALKAIADAGLYEFISRALVLSYAKRLQSVDEADKLLGCPHKTERDSAKPLNDSPSHDSPVKGIKKKGTKKIVAVVCLLLFFFVVKSCGKSPSQETKPAVQSQTKGFAKQTQTAHSDKYEQVLKIYQEAIRLLGNENYKEAKVYFKRVLDCTSDDERVLDIKTICAIHLGVLYLSGKYGEPEDYDKAFKLLSSSLSRSENLSKYDQMYHYLFLGHCYRDGRGT
ncbi:MAG: serine/threonine-protein kinase, partial [Desulfovibrionaceae bacterium]|nr:serine/threonine-protein kinase [Desulfovibrionaceae bacterium]